MSKTHIGLRLRSYNFIKLLGEGAWGKVYEVYDSRTDSRCACKVIPKHHFIKTPKLKELVSSEIIVLKNVKNQNVIRYIDSFSTQKEIFIFTQFCNGGDMEQYLEKKKRLLQDEARGFLKQILNGFLGLHSIRALHRDFKAANVLLHNGIAKIADLGFSKILKDSNVTQTILGTSVTMAPELLDSKPYGIQCDVWSIGVVYYQLIIGDYPYFGKSDAEILKRIKAYPPRFPENIEISETSKDFIRKCLTIDPKKRISWSEIYQHPLFDQNKMKHRSVHMSTLMSKIDMAKNKNVYNQGISYEPKQQNTNYNFQQIKDNELEASDRLDKIQEQAKKKAILEKTIMNYSELYLQRRNLIMLTIKYGISLIFELQSLPFSQHLYAFLISKRAYLEIRDFMLYVKNKKNIFGIKMYWEQFCSSSQYSEIAKQLEIDYQFIKLYAQSFIKQIPLNPNTDIQKQLNLQIVTNKFNTTYKQQLTSYAIQLYNHRDNPSIKKSVLLRLMTFVSDLIKGIMISPEDYERQIQSLDIKQMQTNFSKKVQDLYKILDIK